MAKRGKRGAPKVRTRTVVKYKTRHVAVKASHRVRRAGSSLAKERGPVALFGAAVGYLDAQRVKGGQLQATIAKIPTFGGASWEATVGAAAHFYHRQNRTAKWADKLATAALTIAAYKFVRQQQGAAIAGSGAGNGGWISGADVGAISTTGPGI
jgi:hypothetical protein